MSKLGVNVGDSPTGLGLFLQMTFDAGSPVPVLFALDIDVSPDVRSKSPTTKIVYRTQQYGADNGNMYVGNSAEAIMAGRARVDQCISNWRLNPADFYSADNEPGRNDAPGLSWICNYNLGEMQRADELGVKLGIGAWSFGMPPLDIASVALYIPMLTYAMANGHVLLLHEYSGNGPMIGSPYCLRYRELYAGLPLNARPKIVISEAGPDAGYGMGYKGQAYIDVVGAYDAEVVEDDEVIGVCLYTLKKGESNMAEVMPLLTTYVIDHPDEEIEPPVDDDVFPFVVVSHLIPQDTTDDEYNMVQAEALPAKQDLLFSADIAKANTLHGLPGSKIIVWQPNRWQDSITDYLAPAPIELRYFTQSNTHLIDVPWVGQNTVRTDDDYTNSDCGAADVSMWLRYRGVTVSVDQVSIATGLPRNYQYTTFVDLDKAANTFGLDLRYERGTITPAMIRAEIDAKRPVILLVHYPDLPKKFDPVYTLSHWIVITGYTDVGYIYSDPYWPDETGGKNIPITLAQLAVALQNVTLNGNTANQGILEQVKSLSSTAWRGLHMRADGHSDGADFSALHVAKCNAAKIMTNTGFDELARLITEGIAPDHVVLRLFTAGDNPSLKSAAKFFDEQRAWLTEFNAQGGRYVEVHNEPNHPDEGMGTAWKTAFAFGGWYEGVARLIRSAFPSLKIGWPGLWPDATSSPDFITAMRASIAIGLVDWVGAHAYWGNDAQMNDNENGRWYRRLMGYGKPVLITEFSNNLGNDSDMIKGQQYKRYYASLEAGVIGAFAFVSSASNNVFNIRRETWARNGTVTDIPVECGK